MRKCCSSELVPSPIINEETTTLKGSEQVLIYKGAKMNKTKLIIILLILIFTFLFTEDNFHFAILGDRTGGADQQEFEKVVKEMSAMRPDFVVTVGDFAEDGRNPEDYDVPLETMKLSNQ